MYLVSRKFLYNRFCRTKNSITNWQQGEKKEKIFSKNKTFIYSFENIHTFCIIGSRFFTDLDYEFFVIFGVYHFNAQNVQTVKQTSTLVSPILVSALSKWNKRGNYR